MNVSPFTQLCQDDKFKVLKELQEGSSIPNFAADLKSALCFINGKTEGKLTPAVKDLAEKINNKARELPKQDFNAHYEPWKSKVVTLTGLCWICDWTMRGMIMSSLSIGRLSIYSFKNSKCFAIANACAALGLVFFSYALRCYSLLLHNHRLVINNLNTDNRLFFSKKIDDNYETIEKNSRLFCFYFGARKKTLTSQEHVGLQLLKEELDAIKEIESFLAFKVANINTSNNTIASIDLERTKAVFNKLEKVLNCGKKLAAFGAFIGLGYFYCAYVAQAYLMVIAGLIFSLASGVLCGVAHSYEIGAAKIKNADNENLLRLFNSHIAGNLASNIDDKCSLQNLVVIPLEKILKLIPINP